jgi:hypothetical protein
METAEIHDVSSPKTVIVILTALRSSDVTERQSYVTEVSCFVREFQQENQSRLMNKATTSVSVFWFSHCLASTLYHNLITSSRTRNDGIAELVYQRVDALVFNTYLKARCEVLNKGTVTTKKCGPQAADLVTWKGTPRETRATQVPLRTQDKTLEGWPPQMQS